MAGRFGGRDAVLGEQQVDDFLGWFRAQFGRDGNKSVGAAGKVGGEVEGRGGAKAIALAAAFGQVGSPGLGRPPPSDLKLGSSILVAISGKGRGQRSRWARTRSKAQRARISASDVGRPGRRQR